MANQFSPTAAPSGGPSLLQLLTEAGRAFEADDIRKSRAQDRDIRGERHEMDRHERGFRPGQIPDDEPTADSQLEAGQLFDGARIGMAGEGRSDTALFQPNPLAQEFGRASGGVGQGVINPGQFVPGVGFTPKPIFTPGINGAEPNPMSQVSDDLYFDPSQTRTARDFGMRRDAQREERNLLADMLMAAREGTTPEQAMAVASGLPVSAVFPRESRPEEQSQIGPEQLREMGVPDEYIQLAMEDDVFRRQIINALSEAALPQVQEPFLGIDEIVALGVDPETAAIIAESKDDVLLLEYVRRARPQGTTGGSGRGITPNTVLGLLADIDELTPGQRIRLANRIAAGDELAYVELDALLAQEEELEAESGHSLFGRILRGMLRARQLGSPVPKGTLAPQGERAPSGKQTITEDEADYLREVKGWTDRQIRGRYDVR